MIVRKSEKLFILCTTEFFVPSHVESINVVDNLSEAQKTDIKDGFIDFHLVDIDASPD